jgi:recombination protein RecA
MSQALRKLTGTINRTKTVLIFINQIREKIGVMFGSPETTTGGRALKFYATIRLDIRRIGAIKEGTVVVGNRTRVKVVKNKVAPPFRFAEFDIIFGIGISFLGELVDISVENDIITKSGSWYSYGDVKVGQGRDSVKLWLEENDTVREEIVHKVKDVLGMFVVEENTDSKAPANKKAKDEDKEVPEQQVPEEIAG